MEQLQEHFASNSHLYKSGLLEAVKAIVSTIMVGISFGCFYLIYFLYGIFRLSKDSREFKHKR